MAITLLEDIVNRFIVNSPADHTVEEYSGNTNVSAINSVLVYSRKENVKVFARVTATQVWQTLGVVGNDLDSVSGHGTEYRKDAVFNVTTMDRVSIISLGAETTARIVFNPSLPTEALSNATPSGSTTSQTAVTSMDQDQVETITIDSGTTPIIQIFEDTVIPGAGSTELDVLRLHLDSDFTDSSASGHTLTPVGSATITTSEKKFGAGSLNLSAAGYMTVAGSSDFNLGTGDFTIECWARTSHIQSGNGAVYLFDLRPNGVTCGAMYQNRAYFHINGVALPYNGNAIGSNFNDGAWHHFALVRNGTTVTLYLDGFALGSVTDSGNVGGSSTWFIGTAQNSTSAGRWPGHIDDFRMTKGLARYTANFTVPAAAHPDANSAGTTRTLDKSSTYEIEHASDTTVEVKKLTAGSADVKIRLI